LGFSLSLSNSKKLIHNKMLSLDFSKLNSKLFECGESHVERRILKSSWVSLSLSQIQKTDQQQNAFT